MARLKTDPITAADLANFVASDSDFGFEMQVLAQLREEGFSCSHSGTYRDPVTDKIRQYDIRATMERGDSTLALAVECKNLRPNNPLLLSSVPRIAAEAFHEVLVAYPSPQMWQTKHVAGSASAYKPGDMVAKKTDQVGRDTSGDLVSNDETTFDKLNQAINSCRDLLCAFPGASPRAQRAVIPVLVVPTGRLWRVDYGPDGLLTTPPRQVSRAALFYDHTWPTSRFSGGPQTPYRLSHIELVTFDALAGIAESWFGQGGFFPS
jgi:hypothetical protein